MFLYDIKEKSLDVYDLTANKNDLIAYRSKQMERISESERIFVAEVCTNHLNDTLLLFFEYYTDKTSNNKILSASYADNESDERSNIDHYRNYHVLKSDNKNKKNNEILLDSYILGHLANRSIVQIQYPERIKYYLLTKAKYSFVELDKDGFKFKMEDIIQLPESLYLLRLLEQGKFTSLDGKDISEQLALFTLTKVYEISIEELQKMDAYNITQEAYSRTIKKAENDSHILKLIKK